MTKTVGELIHPHSALGRKFWGGVQGDCLSFRNWILPAPASVRQEGDKLYILDAPLDVKMETQYLASHGQSSARSCPEQDQATEDHNEAHYRSLILPRLKKAINTAPEYAALRRVHLARVAAQWYRELSRTKETTYGDLIDSGERRPPTGTGPSGSGHRPHARRRQGGSAHPRNRCPGAHGRCVCCPPRSSCCSPCCGGAGTA